MGKTDGRTNGTKQDRQLEGQKDVRNGQMERPTDGTNGTKRMDVRTDAKTNGRTEGRTDGRKDGRTDARTDGTN